MIIRNSKIEDYIQIANIHKKYLPSGLSDLTPLGINILKRFYDNIIKRKTGILFIAEDETKNNIAGFSLISHNTNDMFKNTLLNNFNDYVNFLTKANKFALFKIFFKQWKYRNLKISKNPQLVYIAVDKHYEGQGIGKKLICKIEEYFDSVNIKTYELDVEKKNISAVNFYYKLGFEKINEYIYGNQTKYLLRKTI